MIEKSTENTLLLSNIITEGISHHIHGPTHSPRGERIIERWGLFKTHSYVSNTLNFSSDGLWHSCLWTLTFNVPPKWNGLPTHVQKSRSFLFSENLFKWAVLCINAHVPSPYIKQRHSLNTRVLSEIFCGTFHIIS